MAQKKHKPEEIVAKLRQVDVLLSQGRSRQKGMWMGGTVPLGYEARDRKLVVQETEAALVRSIFERFARSPQGKGARDPRTDEARGKRSRPGGPLH